MIAEGRRARWVVAPAVIALVAAVQLSAPRPVCSTAPGTTPAFADVRSIVNRRCLPCHSAFPTDSTFSAGPPPGGVAFDSPAAIQGLAERIRVRVVETQTMPFANKTAMTPDERALLGRWIAAGAPLR